MAGLIEHVKAMLGISAYQPPVNPAARSVTDPDVERARKLAGGNLVPLPSTKLRWYRKEVESAQYAADAGQFQQAAQLYRAMRGDGTIYGLLSTRAAGLLCLTRSFTGDEKMVGLLTSRSNDQTLFDATYPPSEVQLWLEDAIMMGWAVAELVPVPGRANPIMIRHDPEHVMYRWHENQWYLRGAAGLIPITPGDGRWMLLTFGGRQTPWQTGAWIACGYAFVDKSHAKLYRGNYGSKLANPARVLHAPPAAQEHERGNALLRLAAWGINTVLELPLGWEASLLESKGEGYQVWKDDEESANTDIKMAIAGQLVTSDGGTGFDKGDLFKTIRSDIVQTDGNKLAACFNTQGLPQLTYVLVGEPAAIGNPAAVAWDTTPPQDRQRIASMMTTGADAITKLMQAAKPHGYEVDIGTLIVQLGLPLVKSTAEVKSVKLEITPTDVAKVTRAIEIRASQNLEPFGDERDQMTIPEIDARAVAQAQAAAAALTPAELTPEENANANEEV